MMVDDATDIPSIRKEELQKSPCEYCGLYYIRKTHDATTGDCKSFVCKKCKNILQWQRRYCIPYLNDLNQIIENMEKMCFENGEEDRVKVKSVYEIDEISRKCQVCKKDDSTLLKCDFCLKTPKRKRLVETNLIEKLDFNICQKCYYVLKWVLKIGKMK